MTNNYLIRGVITTTSPVHQASPDSPGKTLRMPVSSGAELIHDVPYVTVNSVRGLMRRLASKRVFGALADREERIERGTYLSVVRGSSSRKDVEAGGGTFAQRKAAGNHVFAGLFGGGSAMYPSKLIGTSELLPILYAFKDIFPPEISSQAIRLSTRKFKKEASETGDKKEKSVLLPYIYGDGLLTARDDFSEVPEFDVVIDGESQFNEHQLHGLMQRNEKRENISQIKSEMAEGKKSTTEAIKIDSLKNFVTHDFIVPGVPLYFSFKLKGVTEAQLGLALVTIRDWVNLNQLGGRIARGYGSFKAALSLESFDMNGNSVRIADNLVNGDAPTAKLSSAEVVEKAVAAFNEAISEHSSFEALASVYPPETRKAVQEKAAKEKAAKGKTKKAANDALDAAAA